MPEYQVSQVFIREALVTSIQPPMTFKHHVGGLSLFFYVVFSVSPTHQPRQDPIGALSCLPLTTGSVIWW